MKKTIMVRKAACALSLAGVCTLGFGASASAQSLGDVILNEWNAVKDTNLLDDNESDPVFGRIAGNGGNWIELVVINPVNLQGAVISWQNNQGESGNLTFSSSASVWSNLQPGTIITLREPDGAAPSNTAPVADGVTNASYDPCNGDHWIHVDLDSPSGLVTVGGANGWKVDNDDWRAQITKGGTTIQPWVGEGGGIWAGSNLANEEVGKLEECPSADAANPATSPNYNDGDSSTFSQPNKWDDGLSSQAACFVALRERVECD